MDPFGRYFWWVPHRDPLGNPHRRLPKGIPQGDRPPRGFPRAPPWENPPRPRGIHQGMPPTPHHPIGQPKHVAVGFRFRSIWLTITAPRSLKANPLFQTNCSRSPTSTTAVCPQLEPTHLEQLSLSIPILDNTGANIHSATGWIDLALFQGLFLINKKQEH